MDTHRKSDLSGRTTVVVGASRGLGRGNARAFARLVLRWSRLPGTALAELAATSANIRTKVADASDLLCVQNSGLDTLTPTT
jgi:NAD(P)-dependent dehydrogenase (short-subunit alcohol dehydrogenase family)